MSSQFDLLSIKGRPKLLLHSCCAPCSSYVINYLKDYFDLTVFYYNPNIAPYDEYLKRKEEQIRLLNLLNINYLDCNYDNYKYEDLIKDLKDEPEGGKRCYQCFSLRLEETAKTSRDNNFLYFGTTLTVSPYKNSKVINEIGQSLADKYNLNWLNADFKKNDGYKKSIILSKEYNLYRQNYCGCLYSKK